MKILETQSAMLANHEVAAHIKQLQAKSAANPQYTKHDSRRTHDGRDVAVYTGKLRNLHFVVDDVSRYFGDSKGYNTAASNGHGAASNAIKSDHNPSHKLLQRLKPYQLTKTELLMLVNLQPENIEQLEPLIEDVGERFSEQQQEGILGIVAEELVAAR